MFKKKFILTICFLILMFIAINSAASAQKAPPSVVPTKGIIIDKNRFQIGREKFQEDVPVVIGALKIGDLPLSFSSQPQDIQQLDWLQNISFKVKNVTEKKITYVGIYLHFPETQATGLPMLHSLTYGRFSGFTRDGRSATLGERNKLLELGSLEDLDVSVKDNYEAIVRFIETRQPISTIKSVTISLSRIGFEDGTYWSPCGGPPCYAKYDIKNPGQIISLDTPKLIPFTDNSF